VLVDRPGFRARREARMVTAAGVGLSSSESAAAALAHTAPYETSSSVSSASEAATALLDRISELLAEGYVDWDGHSEDAADSSSADDLDEDDPDSEFALVDNGWLARHWDVLTGD
jgi:hypothetical protein